MKKSRFRILLLFFCVVLFNVLLLGKIHGKLLANTCFSCDNVWENFRAGNIPEDVMMTFWEETKDRADFVQLLTMYFGADGTVKDPELLEDALSFVKQYRKEDFTAMNRLVASGWMNLSCFPVGEVKSKPTASVTFTDSWMQSRTFGGDRGHEGCDIMATVNERGIYPVYSMTDGVVENIGWLTLGGYRIGIRSDSGAYFYYAHLAEYAKEFEVGERVRAGDCLGMMGDTGYSEIPGTTGNFAVHLHLGIYVTDGNGDEVSVNSYPMLRYLWNLEE